MGHIFLVLPMSGNFVYILLIALLSCRHSVLNVFVLAAINMVGFKLQTISWVALQISALLLALMGLSVCSCNSQRFEQFTLKPLELSLAASFQESLYFLVAVVAFNPLVLHANKIRSFF